MKEIIAFILALIGLFARGTREESRMNGVWVTQFDICRSFECADEDAANAAADEMCANISNAGCDTVFLQLHPNGDSIYPSEIFPASKYVTGAYGAEMRTDICRILTDRLTSEGIKVYAWINPYRLMRVSDIGLTDSNTPLYKAYADNDGTVREWNGMLYFDPSSFRARELVCACADEIMSNYPVEGIVIDDYFYPTDSGDFDRDAFEKSGYADLGDFRRDSITELIRSLRSLTSSHGKLFAVAPAGNVYSLYAGYYLDIEKWCGEGYVDLVSPQIYFGFINQYCPFFRVLRDWERVCGDVPVVPSLAAYKALDADADKFAGYGRYEWICDSGVLGREMRYCRRRYGGSVLFSYESICGLGVDKVKGMW